MYVYIYIYIYSSIQDYNEQRKFPMKAQRRPRFGQRRQINAESVGCRV